MIQASSMTTLWVRVSRGKAEERVSKYRTNFSVLGEEGYDNLLRMMASRALTIVKILYDNGYLEKKEIIDTLT